jgi:hypothetical protein
MAMADQDIVRITAKMSYSGGDIQNVFHVRYTMATPTDDATFMADTADEIDTYYGDINTQISSTVSYDTIAFYNITQDRPMGEVAWPTRTAGGNSTGEHLPPQTSPLVLFGTYTPKSQGRKYLPMLTTNNTGNLGSVDSVVLTALATWAANFLADAVIGGGYIEFGNWNDTLSRFAVWITAFVKDYLHTQRRRSRAVGS